MICATHFASRLNAEGVDILSIKELLGHSTVKMTERYTHVNLEQKREAVNRLSKAADNGVADPKKLSQIPDKNGQDKKEGSVICLFFNELERARI